MRALVLENETDKAQEILSILELSGHQGNVYLCTKDAKDGIQRNKYDVFIIDLKVSKRNRQKEDTKHGMEFVQYIFESARTDFYRPQEVIVISGYLSGEIDMQLRKYPVTVISYDTIGTWKGNLQSRLKQFSNYSCDIVIITATEVEFMAFKKWGWEDGDKIQDLIYYKKIIKGKNGENIRLLLVKQEGMGMVPATVVTNKVIEYFMPKCVIMSGICAGRKEAVNLGDVIVCTQVWDYGSGSLEDEGRKIKLVPAPDYVMIPQEINTLLKRDLTNEFLIKMKEKVKEIAKEEENGNLLEMAKQQIREQNRIHFGIMATGAAVIKSENFTTNYIKSQILSILAFKIGRAHV